MTLKDYMDLFCVHRQLFAERLGIHSQTLYNYERRLREPPLSTALKIVTETEGMVSIPELMKASTNDDINETDLL